MRIGLKSQQVFQSRLQQFVPAIAVPLGGVHYALNPEVTFADPILRQVRSDLRQCEAYKAYAHSTPAPELTFARNTAGQCTQQRPGSADYFCACCKFTDTESLLDGVISRYFAPFYCADLYAGVSISQLFAVHLLHALDDRQTIQEILSGRYEWTELVARHFSRLQWRALKCEQERALSEWANFISTVNSSPPGTALTMTEEQRSDLLAQLLPQVPPQPEDGAFIFRREWREQLTRGMAEQVEAYFAQVDIEPNKTPSFPYPLYHILDSWLMHGFFEPETAEEHFITEVLLKPEKQRRMVNACRNYFETSLEIITDRTNLTLADFHETDRHESWTPMQSELEVCREVLENGAMRTLWTHYNGGGQFRITYQRFFVCAEFFAAEVLQALLTEHRFESDCEVLFTWLRQEQLMQNNYNNKTFALAIECSAAAMANKATEYRRLFDELCISERTIIKQDVPADEDAFANGYFVILANGEEDERDNMEW